MAQLTGARSRLFRAQAHLVAAALDGAVALPVDDAPLPPPWLRGLGQKMDGWMDG